MAQDDSREGTDVDPTSSKKQATKLGDIFSYCERKDDVICQICQEACAVAYANLPMGNDGTGGKLII